MNMNASERMNGVERPGEIMEVFAKFLEANPGDNDLQQVIGHVVLAINSGKIHLLRRYLDDLYAQAVKWQGVQEDYARLVQEESVNCIRL
jgi:hypothetical protein